MKELYRLYGAEFSLYTGKLRAYLRKKGVPFEEITSTLQVYKKFIIPRTGVQYIPVLQTPEDQVYQDTTVIIDELEKRYPQHSVYPDTPKQKLVSLLLEVYADEWLVIPAMHYRWNYPEQNAKFIYKEFGSMAMPRMPGFVQRMLGKKVGGKFKGFVPKLGILEHNRTAIEKSYLALLADLQNHFEQHRFLLGSKPSIADFAFMGPLYAHLFRDPAPGEEMRKRAPAVCDWVNRMNDEHKYLEYGDYLEGDQIPASLIPILRRMAAEQLPVLQDTDRLLDEWRQNNPDRQEVKRIIGMHKFTVEGVEAERVVLPYCLWMFQRPLDHYNGCEDRTAIDDLLNEIGFANSMKQGLKNRLTRENNRLQFV